MSGSRLWKQRSAQYCGPHGKDFIFVLRSSYYCCFYCPYRQEFASGDKVTSFGKEYLCNTCLSREPNVAAKLDISTTSDEADTHDDVDDRKLKMKYSSVSAPATPAKQDLSVSGQSVTISDADISLDMSTRSLLDVQTADGMCTTVLSYVQHYSLQI